MHRFLTIIASGAMLLVLAACQSTTAQVPPAVQTPSILSQITAEERVAAAQAKWGDHYAERLALFIEDGQTREPGGVVFLGDSITEQFPLDEAFQGQNVANRGIGGDVVDGVIDRLDICVGALQPRRVYLMIGINNLAWATPDIPLDEFMGRYRVLFEGLREYAPDAEIIVQSILPARGQRWGGANTRVIEVNAELQSLADEFGFEWVNLYPHFLNEEGVLRDDYASDAVHLNVSGYMAWLQEISEDDSVETLINLAPLWLLVNGIERPVHKIDPPYDGQYPGSRLRHELVIYTPAYERESTGTNEWGNEAIVEDGVVVSLNQNDSPIPANGYVVSGHLLANWWITTNLHPGVRVEYDEDSIRIIPPAEEEMTSAERLRFLRIQTLQILVSDESSRVQSGGRALLRAILEAETDPDNVTVEELDTLSVRLRSLS